MGSRPPRLGHLGQLTSLSDPPCPPQPNRPAPSLDDEEQHCWGGDLSAQATLSLRKPGRQRLTGLEFSLQEHGAFPSISGLAPRGPTTEGSTRLLGPAWGCGLPQTNITPQNVTTQLSPPLLCDLSLNLGMDRQSPEELPEGDEQGDLGLGLQGPSSSDTRTSHWGLRW